MTLTSQANPHSITVSFFLRFENHVKWPPAILSFYHLMRGFLESLRNLLLRKAEGSEGLPYLLLCDLKEKNLKESVVAKMFLC